MFSLSRRIRVLSVSAPLVAVAFFAVLTPARADVAVAPGTPVQTPVTEPAPEKCPHIGVQWEDPRVSVTGPQICNASISINIGVDGIGGTITWTSATCPSYILVVPGHNKQVHKVGYKPGNCQQIPYVKMTFKCVSCGFLWLFTCCESTGSSNTTNTVTTCEEFPCPVQTVFN